MPRVPTSLRLACALGALATACGGAPADTAARAGDAAKRDARPAAPAPPQDLRDAGPLETLGRLQPIDGAVGHPEIVAARDTLLAIVARRDTAALLAMVAPDVKNSFGGDDGPEGFKARWFGPDAEEPVWPLLEDLLRNGGEAAGPASFTAPWWFTAQYPDTADPFSVMVAADRDVRVYAAPDSAARLLGRLQYDVVPLADAGAKDGWTAIGIGEGRTAFVASRDLRSPVGHRLRLERRDGRWLIVFLLAGD